MLHRKSQFTRVRGRDRVIRLRRNPSRSLVKSWETLSYVHFSVWCMLYRRSQVTGCWHVFWDYRFDCPCYDSWWGLWRFITHCCLCGIGLLLAVAFSPPAWRTDVEFCRRGSFFLVACLASSILSMFRHKGWITRPRVDRLTAQCCSAGDLYRGVPIWLDSHQFSPVAMIRTVSQKSICAVTVASLVWWLVTEWLIWSFQGCLQACWCYDHLSLAP